MGATTPAGVGPSTSRATSTAVASISDWALEVSPWLNPPGGSRSVDADGVLGDEPSEPGGHAQAEPRAPSAPAAPSTPPLPARRLLPAPPATRQRRIAQHVGHRGDAVGGVVVARSAEVGEPAGDRQPPRVVEWRSPAPRRPVRRPREARVEVENVDVVDAELPPDPTPPPPPPPPPCARGHRHRPPRKRPRRRPSRRRRWRANDPGRAGPSGTGCRWRRPPTRRRRPDRRPRHVGLRPGSTPAGPPLGRTRGRRTSTWCRGRIRGDCRRTGWRWL